MQRALLLSLAVVLPAAAGCRDKEVELVRGQLEGKVCNEEGEPLSGATVVVEGKTIADPVVASGEGQFAVRGLVAGEYTITATLAGYTRTLTAAVEAGKTAVVNDVACRPPPVDPDTGSLFGQICNRHTGDVVTNATIIIALAQGGTMDGTTDGEGRFDIAGIPEGTHIANISGVGYSRAFLVEIVKGRDTELDLAEDCESVELGQGGIVGRFCDPNGGPNDNFDGARVTATSESDPSENGLDTTDLDGEFEINGLTPGLYTVVVEGLFTREHVEVFAGQLTPVEDPSACADPVVLGSILGDICDFDAGGAFNGTAELRFTTSDSLLDTAPITGGAFEFVDVIPGLYNVTARSANGAYVREFEVEVRENLANNFVSDDGECPAPDDVCTQFVSSAEQSQDGRVYLVVDKSGSMLDPFNPTAPLNQQVQKWSALKEALIGVTQSLTGVVEFALELYPRRGGGDCDPGTEIVGMNLNNAGTIEGELDATGANGGTPTAASLVVAQQQLQQQGLLSDGRPLAVLLATDGGPNCNSGHANPCVCTDTSFTPDQCPAVACLDDTNALASVTALHNQGVKVYVLGITGAESYSNVLDQMAIQGGTALPGPSGTARYYRADNPQQLQAAIDAILTRVVACRVETDVALGGANSITVSVGATTVTRDESHFNGWDIVGTNTIELFGSACTLAADSSQPITVETCFTPDP